MAEIEVVKGPNLGQRYRLESDSTVLGRHPECDIVLDVAAVSRQHAKIYSDSGGFFVEDLKSRNGTFVNGREVQGRTAIGEGDRVKICDIDFLFHDGLASSELAGPLPLSASSSSMAMLVEDPASRPKRSTIMSTLDVSSRSQRPYLTVRPEVKLRAMVEIMRGLGGALDLESMLPRLLDSLFKIFPQADRGFVVLRPSDTGPLVPMAAKYRQADADETARLSRTILQQAMESKEAVLSADAATDERFNMAQSVADFQIRSLMCAPLIDSDGRALGVIQIDTLSQRSRFTEDDLSVLAAVAVQGAIWIDNAQLHERAIEQEKLERDLVLARKVQEGLLPASPPRVKGYHFFDFYQAANQVGGDYYDYVPLSENRIAVVVGDVAGKGVSAALLMAKLAGDVRFLLASESDLAVAVRRINAAFARRSWEDRFVTFVAALLDPVRHQLSLVNAGHMPPLLRRAEGEIVEVGGDEAGLPLGVVDDFPYECSTYPLAAGDSLTIFTDGFSEAMNAEGQLYGLARLRDQIASPTLTASGLGEQLLAGVRQFVAGHEQSDDMCLACFGRLEISDF